MTEYIFFPKRSGKRSRLYSGRFTLVRGENPRTVSLGTPDKIVARKRLRDIIVQAQREAEGIVAPKAQREAAAATLTELLGDYESDLRARGRTGQHVHDTTQRIRRILRETGWLRLKDIRPDQFAKWRATLSLSAKTMKEYQAAITAWLNWLVRMDRLAINPLGKVPHVSTKGKQVRIARAFTAEELVKLFAVKSRRLVYLVLAYTGQRRSEVASLVWGDVKLAEEKPFALFRAEEMKDRDKRAVPLHPQLAAELKAAKPAGVAEDAKVFTSFPKWKTLLRDLERAGIERKDSTGRVVHFHSFRKTFQTLGVKHGINQRAAQELLGHSDANLTAKVYTDVPALGLHGEVAKLPWLGAGDDALKHSLPDSLKSERTAIAGRFSQLCRELLDLSQLVEKNPLASFPPVIEWGGQRDSNYGGEAGQSFDPERLRQAGDAAAIAIRSLLRSGGPRK